MLLPVTSDVTMLNRRETSAATGSTHLVCFLENIEGGLVLAQQGEAPPHLLDVTHVLRVETSGRLEER